MIFDYLKLFDDGGDVGAADGYAEGVSSTPTTAEPADNGIATEQKTEKTFSHEEVEGIVKGRLKNTSAKLQEAEDRWNTHSPVFDALRERFGTDDPAEWANRIRNDESYISEEAEKRGMSREATRTVLELERRTKQLEAERKRVEADKAWAEQVTKWRGEETKLQEEFPNFTLDEEFENPTFRTLLHNGLSVRNAYMGIHADDIIKGSIQYAVERGREIQADNIIAGRSRPSENAVSPLKGSTNKKSVRDMTDKEFSELVARVDRSRGSGKYIRP